MTLPSKWSYLGLSTPLFQKKVAMPLASVYEMELDWK